MADLFSNPRLAAGRDRALAIYHSHRVRKWSLIAVIAIVVFGLLGFLAAPYIIRSQIEKRASAALQRQVTLGAVHLNPYTLRLELDQLHIADGDGKSPFVDIDQAVINASWGSLFRLKPVLDELSLQRPRIRIVRTGDQRFNFSDIIDRFNATPSDPNAPPTRFALSNISVHGGDIQFQDDALKTSHHVENLELGIPFIANLPSDTDIFVQPLLSMKVDGSPLRMDGHTKPFADNRESTIDFRLDRLDLARYIAYAPTTLPVRIPKGLLSGDLTLHFVQAKPEPQLQLTGKLQLDDFTLNSSDGQAILSLGKGTADLSDVQPLQSRYVIGALALEQAQLYYTSTPEGRSNFDTLTAAPAKPASDAKAQPMDLRIASMTLANSAIHYANATGKIDVNNLHGGIQGLNMQAAPAAKLDVTAQFFGGELSMKGTVDLAKSKFVAALNAKQVDMAPLQAATYQGLAARLTNGKLDAIGQLQVDWGKPFNIHLSNAHATVTDFAMEPQYKGHDSPVAWKVLESEITQIDLATQQAQLGTVKATGLSLDVQRNTNKYISLVDLFAAKGAPAKKTEVSSTPWHWSIAHLVFDNAAVAFTDLAAGSDKPVKIKISSLSGGMDNLSDKLNEPREMKLSGNIDKGSFTANGKVQPMPTLADIQLDTKRLDISSFQPYISVPLNVTISSARITSTGKLHYDGRSAEPKMTYKGNAALEQVRIQDKLTGDDFLRWRALSSNQLDVSYGIGAPRMHVASLVLSSFYARMIVNSNGTLNLSEVVANPESAPVSVTRGENEQPVPGKPAPAASAPTPPPARAATSTAKKEVAAAPPAPASTAPATPPADIRIGGITLVNGQLNYTDNFIKPNYTANMTKLTGKIGAFGTTPGDPPAELSVQAALNDDSPIDIDGTINPLQPVAFLDIKGKANEVELTGLSAYSTKYTGYPITGGKLTMDVHYMLDQRKLNADNHIFITQLTFGDRDESPGIQHLPVKLAVALLKDTQGNIDVNVPVSGSLDDPQFSMGGLIWRAVGNLIAKAVTAPFRLLGAAFAGGDHEDLGYVEFDPGSAVLDKNAEERLGKIVAMLNQKTSLNLDITGRVDPSKDQDGLRKFTVDTMVRRQKALDQDGKSADTSDAALAAVNVTPDEYEKYLRRAYKDDDFKGKPKNFIGLKKSLDPDEMRSLMETNVSVDESAMRDLAQRRAIAVQAWLKGKLDDKRVSLKPAVLDTKGIDDKGKTTRAEFGLHQG